MKRFFRNGMLLMGVLALVGTPSVWALCSGVDSQEVGTIFGGVVSSCPDALPVSGWIYSLNSPGTVNNGAQTNGAVCEVAQVDPGVGTQPCRDQAGSAGDGNVAIQYEFGVSNPGSVGCPVAGGSLPTGSSPMVVQVICNNGASAIMQTGYSFEQLAFILDQAFPGSGVIDADFANGPQITQFSAGPSPSANTVCVSVPTPKVFSDCDATSQNGGQGGTCDPSVGARPVINRGRLYYIQAACNTPPSPRIQDGWVLQGTQPTSAAAVCNVIDRPTVLDQCGYFGVTGLIGAAPGVETGGMVSFIKLSGPNATNDKVKIDKAEFAQGKLVVEFSTTNETSIVSFNVYSGANKLNGSPIMAKGTGSNSYPFEIGRGAMKGGKTVYVEAVKGDGTFEKSDPVTLK